MTFNHVFVVSCIISVSFYFIGKTVSSHTAWLLSLAVPALFAFLCLYRIEERSVDRVNEERRRNHVPPTIEELKAQGFEESVIPSVIRASEPMMESVNGEKIFVTIILGIVMAVPASFVMFVLDSLGVF